MAGAPAKWQGMMLNRKVIHMNKEILKGKWLQVKEDIPTWWDRLSDDDIDRIQGDAERFICTLQESYGYGREDAELEINNFLRLSDSQRRRVA